jgi:EAL domain-containing protein (putative c-di-GMP-specific phosphodiesterase class I)
MQGFTLSQFVFISGILCSLCLAFLLSVIRASFPRSIGGVNKWIWSCGLFSFAAIVLSNQLVGPNALTRIAGNTSFLAGLLMMYLSLHELGQLARPGRAATVFAVVTGAAFAFFTLVVDSNIGRVQAIMTGNMVLCLACVRTLLRFRRKGKPEYFTLLVFAALGLVSFARIVFSTLGLEAPSFAQASAFHQKFNGMAYAVLMVAMMFGFMLLVSSRLRSTLIYLSAFNEGDASLRAEQRELEADLARAIDKGELVLYFQPRVALDTGRVVALEALLRWHHPTRGMIPPDRFIPLAERSKLILPIGRWVLARGVETLNRLQATHPGCTLALNVSTVQLKEDDMVGAVREALEHAQFPAHRIELEITESVFIDEPEKAAVTFAGLKQTGVSLALDDFGTGYSSLSYLKQFPLDCVKIDRSFVSDLPGKPDDVAITTAIIAMGHALGLRVVAEGVETAQQRDFLLAAGCDEYQGYYFSRPVPEEELCAAVTAALKRTAIALPGLGHELAHG